MAISTVPIDIGAVECSPPHQQHGRQLHFSGNGFCGGEHSTAALSMGVVDIAFDRWGDHHWQDGEKV